MKVWKPRTFILPPSSFILALLRDGVTGNTSGFELEDEGSTPSPAAISFKRKLKGTSIDSMKNKEEAPAYRLATINGRPSDSRR